MAAGGALRFRPGRVVIEEPPLARRTASAMAMSTLGMVLNRLVQAAALFVILERFTAADLGTATLVTAIFAVLQTVTEMGLGIALIQKRAQLPPAQLSALFWVSAGLSVLLSALVWAVAPWIASFYDSQVLAPMLRVGSLSLVAYALYVIPRAKMTYAMQFGRIAVVESLGGVAAGGVAVLLALWEWGAWALIWGEVASRAVLLVGFQVLSPYLPRLRGDFRGMGELLRFGGYATGSRMLSEAYANADYLVVGRLFDAASLGIYGFAYRLVADVSRTLRSSFVSVSLPAFVRLNDDIEALCRYLFGMARVSIVVTGVVLIPLAVTLDWLLLPLGYDQWMPAVPYARLLVGVAVVRAAHVLIPRLLNALGLARLNFIYSATNLVLMPLAFFVGGKLGGLAGVAWAWTIVFPVSVLYYCWLAARAVHVALGDFLRGLFGGVGLLLPGLGACLGLRWALAFFAPDAGEQPWGLVLAVGATLLSAVLMAAVPIAVDGKSLVRALRRQRPDVAASSS